MKRLSIALAISMIAAMTLALPAAAEEAEAVTAATCTLRYTVQPGDTLLIIARKYGTTMSALASLNGITNVNRIFYGTSLCVRSGTSSGFYYTVQRGDTLAKIGARYGWSVSYLAAVNRIRNINVIYVGQVLLIPNR